MTVNEFKVNDGYECPTCEKVLNTSLGLKQHHTKVHDESLVEYAECQWCGDDFHAKPSGTNNFCSRACQMDRRKEKGVPARKRRIIVQCPGCGEGFEIRHSERGHKVYCTPECRSSTTNAKELECEQCGGSFRKAGEYADSARFCSQDCYGVWISENQSGSNSVHWKGDDAVDGRPPYGPGFNERKRRIVRERDGYECAECGLSQEEHTERYGMALHVHHEVVARASSNPAVHNAPRNLRTLCAPCHMRIEQG